MMGGSCVGLGGILGTFQAAGNTMLNEKLIKPKPVERLDKENPLLGSTQERRVNFFKVRVRMAHHRSRRQSRSRTMHSIGWTDERRPRRCTGVRPLCTARGRLCAVRRRIAAAVRGTVGLSGWLSCQGKGGEEEKTVGQRVVGRPAVHPSVMAPAAPRALLVGPVDAPRTHRFARYSPCWVRLAQPAVRLCRVGRVGRARKKKLSLLVDRAIFDRAMAPTGTRSPGASARRPPCPPRATWPARAPSRGSVRGSC